MLSGTIPSELGSSKDLRKLKLSKWRVVMLKSIWNQTSFHSLIIIALNHETENDDSEQ